MSLLGQAGLAPRRLVSAPRRDGRWAHRVRGLQPLHPGAHVAKYTARCTLLPARCDVFGASCASSERRRGLFGRRRGDFALPRGSAHHWHDGAAGCASTAAASDDRAFMSCDAAPTSTARATAASVAAPPSTVRAISAGDATSGSADVAISPGDAQPTAHDEAETAKHLSESLEMIHNH